MASRPKGLQRVVALLGLAVVVAGCGSAGHGSSGTAACRGLVKAANLADIAETDMRGGPLSNEDAARRIADAEKEGRAALRTLQATGGSGAAGTTRARLYAALTLFSRELVVAKSDLRTGRTEQQKSQGYVDAGTGVQKVTTAMRAAVAACPPT